MSLPCSTPKLYFIKIWGFYAGKHYSKAIVIPLKFEELEYMLEIMLLYTLDPPLSGRLIYGHVRLLGSLKSVTCAINSNKLSIMETAACSKK